MLLWTTFFFIHLATCRRCIYCCSYIFGRKDMPQEGDDCIIISSIAWGISICDYYKVKNVTEQ